MASKVLNRDFCDEDIDFEDRLSSFEKKFSQCDRGRELYAVRGDHKDVRKVSRFDAKDVEPELRVLWEELVSHIMQEQNKAGSPTATGNVDFSEQIFTSGISKEVFKNEIRTILSQLKSLQNTSEVPATDHLGSHRTTVRSLKRLLAERNQALEALQGKYRQLSNQKNRLEERAENLKRTAIDYHRRHIPLEAEILELREQNELLKRGKAADENSIRRLTAEKHRFQSTIARYREELQLSHHQLESAQLDALQAKNRTAELEKRAQEAKASSNAVNVRVKELQEVQDAMIALMKEAQESSDVGVVRRNLADLGERRSRLVGRIANLLTMGRQSRNRGEDNMPEVDVIESNTRTSVTENSRSVGVHIHDDPTAFGNSGSSTENEIESGANSPENASRRPILDGLRKLGGELTRSTTQRSQAHKAQRKSILANVEKSRVAIENDSALREVIELKEKELERMEDELLNAKEKAAALERSLQKERQRKRLQSRSTHANTHKEEWKSGADGGSMKVTRRKSLFGWQAGDAEGKRGIGFGGSDPFTDTEDEKDEVEMEGKDRSEDAEEGADEDRVEKSGGEKVVSEKKDSEAGKDE